MLPSLFFSSQLRSLTFALLTLSLAACSDDYALVANEYGKTATISALDNQGRGNFARPIPPKSCLIAFKAQPDITTMQIGVYPEENVYKGYDNPDLMRALGGQDFSKGVFVVSEAGLRFEKGYDCDEEIR